MYSFEDYFDWNSESFFKDGLSMMFSKHLLVLKLIWVGVTTSMFRAPLHTKEGRKAWTLASVPPEKSKALKKTKLKKRNGKNRRIFWTSGFAVKYCAIFVVHSKVTSNYDSTPILPYRLSSIKKTKPFFPVSAAPAESHRSWATPPLSGDVLWWLCHTSLSNCPNPQVVTRWCDFLVENWIK